MNTQSSTKLIEINQRGETIDGLWKVVPIEPTDEMVRAGWDVEELVVPERMYYAMLAAAPAQKEES